MQEKKISRDVIYLASNQKVYPPNIFQAQLCKDMNTFSDLLSLQDRFTS